MEKVRAYIFSFVFMIWTLVICFLGLPLSIVPRSRTAMILPHFWASSTIWLLKRIVGLDYELVGLDNVPDEPCIIACKHQSAFETCIFHHIFPKVAYVYKKSLGYIPFVGWHIYSSGSIPIDRSSGSIAMRCLLEGTKSRLKNGYTVVIFPEGTRTAVGQKTEYNPGIAFLYDKIKDVKIIPVALNSGLFWPRYSFMKKSGTIKIEFLPAIDAGLSKREFMQALENKIEKAVKKIVEESVKV